jgi:acyl-coenzyme A synthetase/AMP-(fatty) acid ligase
MEQELLTFCRERIASFKCPKSIDFTDELPRSDNGKLYKRVLREPYWAGHATSI